MNNIKQLVLQRFNILSLLSVSMLFSIILLMIRMKLTHSFFYLFLVWNLFLAVIPFAITTYLSSLPKLNKFMLMVWFSVWLLFLPNAPYIVTDLLHLKISNTSFLWLDILVVLSFAFNGLVLFFISLRDMKSILSTFSMKIKVNYLGASSRGINKKKTLKFSKQASEHLNLDYRVNYIITSILFLTAFGVYLGRFLRYNSWEIISNPKYLFIDILNIAIKPFANSEAWLFTILFGSFLIIGFWMFNNLKNTN